MKPWSLTGRLTIALSAILALLWLAAASTAALIIRHEILEIYDATLVQAANRLADISAASPDLTGIARSAAVGSDRTNDVVFQFRRDSGDVVVHSGKAPEQGFAVPLREGFADLPRWRVYTLRHAGSSFWVQVAQPQGERRGTVRSSILALILPLLVLMIVSGTAVRWTVLRIVAPIGLARQEIARRGAGDLTPIDAPGLPVELAPIAADLNTLLARLKRAFDAERAFAANSAHELRTPVAAAWAQAQVLVNEIDGAPRARAVELTRVLERLSRIVEKLLQLARAEAGVSLSYSPVDLNHLAEAAADPYRRDSRAGSRVSVRALDKPVLVRTDLDTMAIALQNLIENALVHGGESTSVAVTVGHDGSITVADDGIGLPAELLGDIRRRFVRGRTKTDGAGLGLAIVESIVTQAGGTLTLSSRNSGADHGFTAAIRLPVV